MFKVQTPGSVKQRVPLRPKGSRSASQLLSHSRGKPQEINKSREQAYTKVMLLGCCYGFKWNAMLVRCPALELL